MTLDDLIAFGADVDTGLSRCMGNEGLYLRLAGTMQASDEFDRLKDAIEQNKLEEAFEIAQAFKGSLGNLSLTPLYDPICEITELLRSKTDMDYSELVNGIIDKKEQFCAL